MRLFEPEKVKSITDRLVSSLNTALAMAPAAQKHLKNLEGCILKVEITGLDTELYFGVNFTDQRELKQASEGQYHVRLVDSSSAADVSIIGNPLSFVKLLTQKNKAVLLQNKELKLEGDSVRIQQILTFLNALEIDWEGILAELIGDVPAHILGSSLRTGLVWSLSLSQSLLRDTEEFIKYELRLLPDKQQAKNQFSAIAKLKSEIDSLSNRFEKVESTIN